MKRAARRRIVSKQGECNVQLYRVSKKRKYFLKVRKYLNKCERYETFCNDLTPPSRRMPQKEYYFYIYAYTPNFSQDCAVVELQPYLGKCTETGRNSCYLCCYSASSGEIKCFGRLN